MTADWFKHDAGARRDPKLTTLRSTKGDAFAYYYWALIEVLTESKSNEVPRKFYPGVASDIGITLATFRELIDALVDLELIVEDDFGIFSPGHKARMAEYQEKRDAYSAAAKAREERRRAAKNPTPKPNHNCATIVPQRGHEASTLLYSTQINSDQIGSKDLDPKKPPAEAQPHFVIGEAGAIDLDAMQEAPTVRSARLEFTHDALAGLVMNFYHGNAQRLVDDIRAGTDNLIRRGEPALNSERSSAFIRGWIKNKRQFERTGAAPPKKLTNADRVRKFMEENSDESGTSFESHGLDSSGIWGPVRPLPGAAGSVDGDTSASRLRSSSGGNGATTSATVSVPATSRRGTGGGA